MSAGERAIEIGVLGPLTVRVDGRPLAIDGIRRSRLLSALALHRGRWCHAARLAEAVWGDDAGDRSPATLHSHVAHVRRLLDQGRPGAAAVVESGDAGYRLAADLVDVDADRFTAVVSLARTVIATDPAAARRQLDDALALWRGEPFDDVLDPAAAAEAVRLEELRLDAVELGLEAAIRVGDDATAVAEAERAVVDAPLRERRWELLMLALYRTSRQADSLRAYARARDELLRQTGLLPGPGLQRMERLVLEQAAVLLEHDPFAAPPAVPPTEAVRQVEVIPQIRFTRDSGVSIAYQTWGEGPWFVATPPLAQNIEVAWESPYWRRMFDLVGSRTRFVHFDKRGTGVSDRSVDMSFEQRMDDFRAVMDACAIESAVLCGISEGGPLAVAFAAAHPDRVRGLVLYGSFARVLAAPDYPIGLTPERYRATTASWERRWGTPQCSVIDQFSPSLADDDEFRAWSARYMRQSCSPGTLAAIDEANAAVDVRHLLASVRVPTLVLNRTGDRVAPIAWGRYLADHIPGARFVELAGDDHLPWVGRNWADVVGAALDFVHAVG